MRSVKQASIVAVTKAYAEECAASGLYTKVPPKAEWKAIVTKVTTDCGLLRIPYAFSKLNGPMATEWTNAYEAASRRLKRGGKLVKAAPKPKPRKRTPKTGKPAQPEQVTLTQEQLAALVSKAVTEALASLA